MIVIGQGLRVPFAVLATTGTDYTNAGTPPVLKIVQEDLTYAPATNPAELLFGGLWAVQLTAAEMASKLVTLSWSGAGIISGAKSITAEEEEVIEDALLSVSNQILLASPYIPTVPPIPQYVTPVPSPVETGDGGWANG